MANTQENTNDSKFWHAIAKAFARASRSVGVITILLSFAAFGIAGLFVDAMRAVFFALASFGVIGSLEIFHVNAKAKLKDRRTSNRKVNALMEFFLRGHLGGNPEIAEEINYSGLSFNVLRMDQIPMSIGVSKPLCPTCKRTLVEIDNVRFPGRTHIAFECQCGFSKRSDETSEELMRRIADMANIP